LRGKLGFFFGRLAASCFVWSYFRVLETKGRTYEELDIVFERSVRTRQFKDYKLE
jgi:SP family general alpha glucoside:H+ symporter-like MFS transporter